MDAEAGFTLDLDTGALGFDLEAGLVFEDVGLLAVGAGAEAGLVVADAALGLEAGFLASVTA